METLTEVRTRLGARQRQLQVELEQVQEQLKQMDTTVVVSAWWDKPSGDQGRGTLYHAGTNLPCRQGTLNSHPGSPVTISLFEALGAGLSPCGRCRPPRQGQ